MHKILCRKSSVSESQPRAVLPSMFDRKGNKLTDMSEPATVFTLSPMHLTSTKKSERSSDDEHAISTFEISISQVEPEVSNFYFYFVFVFCIY
jgi:hypothetical protein